MRAGAFGDQSLRSAGERIRHLWLSEGRGSRCELEITASPGGGRWFRAYDLNHLHQTCGTGNLSA